jgi:hypothetical protein
MTNQPRSEVARDKVDQIRLLQNGIRVHLHEQWSG